MQMVGRRASTEMLRVRADLRAVEGKQRRSGRAPLTKLTTHQRQVMQRLTDAHGEDIEVCIQILSQSLALVLYEGQCSFSAHGRLPAHGKCN